MPTSKSNQIDINDLAIWVKTFSWEENDARTDAVMRFTIETMGDCPTQGECRAFFHANGDDMSKLCETLAMRFTDTCRIIHMKSIFEECDSSISFDVECAVRLAE